MRKERRLDLALDKLGVEFSSLDLTFHRMEGAAADDVTSYWPGGEDEDILICVFKGTEIEEPFHRQDFFFINYAYRNSYQALSAKYNNLIEVLGKIYTWVVILGFAAVPILVFLGL